MEPSLDAFPSNCSMLRTRIKEDGYLCIQLKEMAVKMQDPDKLTSKTDKGEMIANVTLAYRHLEDAAMRLGKAIQAYETGNSIYDNNDSLRAAGLEK